MMTFDVTRDFSRYPAGRFVSDGPFSGEGLRSLLAPKLRLEPLSVVLDGAEGYSSGFLEECFGGLIRCCGFTFEELKQNLTLQCSDDPSIVDEIWSYIQDASLVSNSRGRSS